MCDVLDKKSSNVQMHNIKKPFLCERFCLNSVYRLKREDLTFPYTVQIHSVAIIRIDVQV